MDNTTRRLTNKDARAAFDHLCDWLDEKYKAWYDDGPASFKTFCEWFEPFVMEPTAEAVAVEKKK